MSLKASIENLEELVLSDVAPGTKRAIVNLDKLTPILDEIKRLIPTEIGNAEALMQQRESIIQQAEIQARQVVENAKQEALALRQVAQEQSTEQIQGARQEAGDMVQSSSIVGEAQQEAQKIKQIAEDRAEEVVSEAKRKANQIVAGGEKEASSRRKESDAYAREVLFAMEERLSKVLGQVREGLDIISNTQE